jgi:hypothetical protein
MFPIMQTERRPNRLKGNILFSSELARRHGGDGIVSISLFPGAVNADISGYAGSFLTRTRKLLVALICFIMQGGDLEALAEDVHPDMDDAVTHTSRNPEGHAHVRRDTTLDDIGAARDHVAELSGSSLRAVTSLYAGTAPDAGRLNGRVRAQSPEQPLEYQLTGLVKLC